MPGRGQIILDVTANEAAIAQLEQRMLQTAGRISRAFGEAFTSLQASVQGHGGGNVGGNPLAMIEAEYFKAARSAEAAAARMAAANQKIYQSMSTMQTAYTGGGSSADSFRTQYETNARQMETSMGRYRQSQEAATKANTGFWAGFYGGFGRAGGFGSAIATVIKYGAAYKMVEGAMAGLMAPATLVQEFLRRGTQSWLEYEDAMAKAQRTMQMPGMRSDVIKEAFRPDVLQFLTQYRTTIKDVATAIYELGSAGANASQVMQEWQPVAKLNIALQGDMTQTARTLTQMLKIHSAEMGANLSDREKMMRLSGIIAKTWQVEQFELSDLAQSYKYVAANAATLKIKAEELVPLLGFMSTYGLRGSIGGTGLNQFLTQLSRTIKITKDGMLELEKVTRGGTITVKTGIKAEGVTGPIQAFAALAQAAKTNENAPWVKQLQQTGMIQDLFNIRGARPALLVIEKFGEYMSRLGDVTKMTTKDWEAFVQSLVDMQQNTPQAQIELLNNTLNVAGQQFITAAMGANTFVDALKMIRQYIASAIPAIQTLGVEVNYALHGLAFAAEHPLTALTGGAWNRKAWNDFNKGQVARVSGSYKRMMLGEVTSEYLKNPSAGAGMARKRVLDRLDSVRTTEIMHANPGMTRKEATSRMIQEKQTGEGVLRFHPGTGYSFFGGGWTSGVSTSATPGVNVTSGTLERRRAVAGIMPADILSEAETVRLTELMTKGGGGTGGGITKIPKTKSGGGGAGKAAHEYRDAIQMITDGILKFEDATAIASEALKRQDVEEQKLSRSMSARLITNANVAESDKLTAQQLKLSANLVKALRNEQGELARESDALKSRLKSAPDESTRSKTLHALSQVTQKQLRNETQIAQEMDKQDEARQRGAALRVSQIMQIREREADAFVRTGRTREEALRRDQAALDALDRTEKVYGETTISQAARIHVLNQQSNDLAASREREEARLVRLKREYEGLLPILKSMESSGKIGAGEVNALRLLGFGEDQIQAIAGSKDAYSALYDVLQKDESQIDSLTSSIESSTRAILDNQSAIDTLNLTLGTSGLSAALDTANLQMERNRDAVESTGREWSTSAERIASASEVLMAAIRLSNQQMMDLDMEFAQGLMSQEEYAKRTQEIAAIPSKALNEWLYRIPRDIRQAKESIQNEIDDMVAGWDWAGERKGNKELSAIRRKVKQMREQHAGNPEMLALVDRWEATAKTDAQMQKWLKKREDIENQWSQSFMQFFSELSSDSKNAAENLWRSLVGSIQEQILSQFLQQALKGLFDQMAITLTGVNPQLVQLQANLISLNAQFEVMMNGGGPGGEGGTAGAVNNLMAAMGGFSGTSSGAGNYLSMLSGNAPSGGGGGGFGGGGFGFGSKWPAGTNTLGKIFGGIGYGSLAGSISGAIFGRDPASAQTGGMIGGVIGGLVGGPVGALVGGFLGGLFGKKKKPAAGTGNDRQLYGMPEFEYQSYLYNMTQGIKADPGSAYLAEKQRLETMLNSPHLIDRITAKEALKKLNATQGQQVNMYIYGDNADKIKQSVMEALTVAFGNTAVANAKRGSIY